MNGTRRGGCPAARRLAGVAVALWIGCGAAWGAAPQARTAPATGPATAPAAARADVGVQTGQVLQLGPRTAAVRLVDVLPYVDNEYTRRFVFDKYGNPKLQRLRAENRLDEVVARGKDEFEKQLLLMDWVYAQIEYGDPISLGRTRNAQDVLDLSRKEQKLFCTQFATLLVSSAASLGWVCRPIGIPTHSFTEMWSNQHRRWVLFDPTANWYVEKGGEPQNIYEVRKDWFQNACKDCVFLRGKDRLKVGGRTFEKYYILLYSTNTNWLDSAPAGSLVTKDQWSGGQGPQNNVMANPAVDPYFPINQAAIRLSPEGQNFQVEIRTLTPNFKTFRVRLDGREWADSPEAFPWPLHDGTNVLEARSVNLFGVAGPVSRIELAAWSGPAAKDDRIVVPAMAFASQGGGKVKVSDPDEEMPPGYVHHWYTKGHWMEWNIPDAEAGDYDLSLTYSSRYHPRRGLEVNGQTAKGLESFEVGPTGSWGNFSQALLPGKVSLKAGSNVLRLSCQDQSSMCLSKLTLSPGLPGKKDIVIDAVTASGEGDGNAERIYAPRGGFFRLWGDPGHALEYVVENAVAGEYQMFLRYGSMYPSPVELRVNGEVAPGLDKFVMPINGGWQEWVEAPLPAKIKLKDGRNVLRMTIVGGNGVNLSDIRLSRPGKPDIFINAAHFARQEGGKVMEYGLSRHGFVYAWGAKGHWLEWTFQCPQAGEYQVTLRRANQNQAAREVRVNGQAVEGLASVVFEPTGGGQAWQETPLAARVRLNKGPNTVRLTNVSGSLSLDEITFAPAK